MNIVVQMPEKLTQIAETGLPVTYEAAKRAILACESPIECRTMADKAAAMVVYARMRDDTGLQNRAVRLQAWASRRWGELDRELYPDRSRSNLRQNKAELPECGRPQSGKRPAPLDGTTEYQRVVSRRLAAIPEPEFVRQVEGDSPPTVAKLAAQGTATRSMSPVSPWARIECSATRASCETLERFVAFCGRSPPEGIGKNVNATEASAIRSLIGAASIWLDQLVAALEIEA